MVISEAVCTVVSGGVIQDCCIFKGASYIHVLVSTYYKRGQNKN